jgi:squalene-associated FAD-dependent desaturase
MSSKSVIVIGAGLAGLSSGVALAEAGFRVKLLEQRPFLGGRASSYSLPDGEEIDNCQHVTLGCCTNLDDFYERVGALGKIARYGRLVFVDSAGHRAVMGASALPAPFHLAPSLAFYPSLNWAEKRGIGEAMLSIARRGGRNNDGDAVGRSMLDWLRSRRQSEGAISRFWSVVLVSALNEELARTEARYGLDVFWKAFLSARSGYVVGIPRVPLGELYEGCRAAIEQRGGEVLCRAAVRGLKEDDGRISGVGMDGGRQYSADFYILAVPHEAALKLLPERVVASEAQFRQIRNLQVSPITSVHFWFDRDVMAEPFVTLLDRTTQWIFNKSRLSEGPGKGRYLQSVISASYGLVERPRQEIINLCLGELQQVLPEAEKAQLIKATVVKETAATFSPQPGADRWRPSQRTPLPNLFLAGDWTATGWPATMEGAVRSGYLAAEAILADCSEPKRLLRPDLPAEGLARHWLRNAALDSFETRTGKVETDAARKS